MGNIDTALYTRLSNFAGLIALTSTRIYPGLAPQDCAYPFVVYEQLSGVRDYVMGNQSGLVSSAFKLDSWGETRSSARSVAEQVRLALSNWHGTSDGVTIDWTEMDTELSDYDAEAFAYRVIQWYTIHHRESLP